MVKAGTAIVASNMFTFDNSLAKGRKMTADLSKLMLRAYNAEADNAPFAAGRERRDRQEAARSVPATIASSARRWRCASATRTTPAPRGARTHRGLLMRSSKRGTAREERERLREERKAQQELSAERERLEKERHTSPTRSTPPSGGSRPRWKRASPTSTRDRGERLPRGEHPGRLRLRHLELGALRARCRQDRHDPPTGAARSGRELGDASVPFRFDVHALFFSEDAVTLENRAHQASPSGAQPRQPAQGVLLRQSRPRSERCSRRRSGTSSSSPNMQRQRSISSRSGWPADIEGPGPRVPQ